MKRTKNAAKRAGYEAELAQPPFPLALAYLWDAFTRMRRRCGSNGYSANPISWSDIDGFDRYSGQRLAPWEVKIIEELDDLFLMRSSGAPT